ncbi:heavy metal-associated isoprenylated plant protein 5 [Forsythia ovata]|uniref:Heavy metal-associated isoprenylated plant protein 5 n=1 Tax=Forsythia ovata TaxID=205694 RepID=A0ABD1TA42_9LAMI
MDSYARGMSSTSKGSRLKGTTLATIESLAVPIEQELVFLADFRCSGCQQRVTEIVSKINEEIQSVVVSVFEKKVTLVCTYPATADKLAVQQASASMHTAQVYCMAMRINLDCNACCRKMRRILLKMKEIETHLIEKQCNRVRVCGRFVPADVAIKIRKKMNRRVEILEIQEFSDVNTHVE